MTDMLIPNRPPKGKNIDEILAGLPKEGALPKAPVIMPATSGFSIEDCGDYYRLPWVDFSKETSVRADWDHFVNFAKSASPDDFRMASAPTVYRICKELYENRANTLWQCVSSVRNSLGLMLVEPIYVHSSIKWESVMRGVFGAGSTVYHKGDPNIGVSGLRGQRLIGLDGLITDPDTQADEYVSMVLSTHDSMRTVNDVFKFITNCDTKIMRLNHYPDDDLYEPVLLGIDNNSPKMRMCITSSSQKDVQRPALMVRYR